jgi:hypothetical protein
MARTNEDFDVWCSEPTATAIAPAAGFGDARCASINSALCSPITAVNGWNRAKSNPGRVDIVAGVSPKLPVLSNNGRSLTCSDFNNPSPEPTRTPRRVTRPMSSTLIAWSSGARAVDAATPLAKRRNTRDAIAL